MIKIYPAASRYSSDLGWLQANFSFSFGDYHDPSNLNFGPLRVFNDDFIHPQRGFGTHPHRDMEIVTVALAGQLQHKDNTGGEEVLKPGEVQRMTAGTGILHSEMNNSETEIANTLQLWFLPSVKGLPPSYEQKSYDPEAMNNQLLPVISSRVKDKQVVYIHQDLTIFLSKLEADQELVFNQEAGRRIYLFVMDGALTLNQESKLAKRDTARIIEVEKLHIRADQNAHFMLIDLP
jgi:redox-sensitive bicupin YhaK (pirin superfamily)